jgi:2-keto-4-pentenoate hydratase/2-oxohepta-3-ene-1,7-dioic acid hydratase in catechol pathway
MKLVTYDAHRLGVLDDDHVIDVTERFADLSDQPTWRQVLAAGRLDDLHALEGTRLRTPLAAVTLAPPVPDARKIVAAPVNYLAHQAEMSWPTTVHELGVFLKASSSMIAHGGEVSLPYTDVRTDQEGELALVIGREARNVPVASALDHVAGYTCLLDITIRSSEDRSARKSFDTFTPVGPWITTADEVGDPENLELRCWVNGELRQHARTSRLIFGVALLISYASSVMTLEPGDIVSTGTPEGVGPLADGDVVAVEVERVGRLQVSVTARDAIAYADRPTIVDARTTA